MHTALQGHILAQKNGEFFAQPKLLSTLLNFIKLLVDFQLHMSALAPVRSHGFNPINFTSERSPLAWSQSLPMLSTELLRSQSLSMFSIQRSLSRRPISIDVLDPALTLPAGSMFINVLDPALTLPAGSMFINVLDPALTLPAGSMFINVLDPALTLPAVSMFINVLDPALTLPQSQFLSMFWIHQPRTHFTVCHFDGIVGAPTSDAKRVRAVARDRSARAGFLGTGTTAAERQVPA